MSILPPQHSLVETLLRHDRPTVWWGLDSFDPLDDDANGASANPLGFRLTAQNAPVDSPTLHRVACDSFAGGSRDFNGTNQAYTAPDQLTVSAAGPPRLHAATSNSATNSQGLVLSPTGIQVGDLMILIALHTTAGATVSGGPGAGWTIRGTALNCTTHTKVVYTRVADATDTVGQQFYGLTWNSSADVHTVMLVVRGCDSSVANLIFDSGEVATGSGTDHFGTTESYPEQSWQLVIFTSDFLGIESPWRPPTSAIWDATANVTLACAAIAYYQPTAGSSNSYASTPVATNLGITTLTFGSPRIVKRSLRNINFPLTISCLINSDSLVGTRNIFRKESAIVLFTTGTTLAYSYHDGVGFQQHNGPTLATGTTYRIWVRDDGANVTFFVNGQKTTVARVNATAIASNANAFWIASNGGVGGFFDGRIDEVALFECALSDQQILTHEEAAVSGTVGDFVTADQSGKFPRLKVEIAMTSNPTDPAFVYTDVTSRVRAQSGLDINWSSRSSELERFAAGTLSLELDNRDRFLNGLAPARAIRVMAQIKPDQGAFPMFFGYTDGPKYKRGATGYDSTVSITATDLFKALAPVKVSTPTVRPTEYAQARIFALLEPYPWFKMVVTPGRHLIIGDDIQGNGLLEHIQQVAESDGGRAWADAWGFLWFEDGHVRSTAATSTTIQATYGWFGTSASRPATSFEPEVDELTLFTAAMVTPASGNVQTKVNPTTKLQAFERTKEVTTLHASDVDAFAMACHYANRYGQAVERVPALRLLPSAAGSLSAVQDMWFNALHHRPSHRIKTIEKPLGGGEIAREHFIEGVKHTINANSWTIDLDLSPTELEGKLFVIGTDKIGVQSPQKTIGW